MVLPLDLLFKVIFVPLFCICCIAFIDFWQACKYGFAVV